MKLKGLLSSCLVVVTLDATEMLKYFNPDGSAVASESLVKVPIKVQLLSTKNCNCNQL